MAMPNGAAAGAPNGAPITTTKLPKVIGINFGNSYASIAVISEVSPLLTCPFSAISDRVRKV
jgi:hypothetical protein